VDITNLKFIFEIFQGPTPKMGGTEIKENVSIAAATKIRHGIGNCIVVGFCPAHG